MNITKSVKPAALKKGPIQETKKSSDFVEPDKDKYGNCIKRCTEKISRNPRDEHAFLERGDAHIYLVSPKEALNDYRRAIEINPNSIKGYYGMATAHIMMGLHKNAVLELTKAMELEQQLSERALEK